jgi:HD-like signal output (HDOD) protein/ActR/RegA family two-component response regulator
MCSAWSKIRTFATRSSPGLAQVGPTNIRHCGVNIWSGDLASDPTIRRMPDMRLILVDNEHHVASSHRRALRTVRPEWDVVLASNAAEAIAAMTAEPADVFISELGKSPVEGVALFETVKERWPASVRIALSEFAERNVALRLERSVHRFLHKPCDTYMLAMLIERSTTLRQVVNDPAVLSAIGGLESIPRPPVTVQALEKVLADPDAGVIAVAAVINRDAALTARLLRVVNSSFFGVGRQVTRVDAAVNFMGVSLVRAIALADGATRAFTVSPDVLDLDEWNTHAVRVATSAREIALAICPQDRSLADEAFLAGLLHDVGQVVMAGVTPVDWKALESAAMHESAALNDVEHRAGRVSHALVGAYLLSLWGLPSSVVEAVAFHHTPDKLAGTMFDAAIAVHVADALAARTPGRAAPLMHLPSVVGAGITEEQLQSWRARYNAFEAAA